MKICASRMSLHDMIQRKQRVECDAAQGSIARASSGHACTDKPLMHRAPSRFLSKIQGGKAHLNTRNFE
jgi:hypothetical protein